MKLIMENWRDYLEEDEELLEEGIKDMIVAAAMGLATLTAPLSATAAEPPAQVQVDKKPYVDTLSDDLKIMLRGVMVLYWNFDEELSAEEKQGILKAAWTFQKSDESTRDTDKYIKEAIQKVSTQLKKKKSKEEQDEAYSYFYDVGSRYKVIKKTQAGFERIPGKPFKRIEKVTYEWKKDTGGGKIEYSKLRTQRN